MGITQTRLIGSTWVNITVTREVEEFSRRLHFGDPTCGWLGDDTLDLRMSIPLDNRGNPLRNEAPQFEVWGRTTEGKEYVALRWPRCDASLLKKLATLDVRCGADQRKVVEKALTEQDDWDSARMGEVWDKMQFALLKDRGHLEGITKRLHSIPGRKEAAA